MAQRTPAATGESMSESVAVMLDGLGPLDPERSVLAGLARQLAGTLDGMSRPMRARMTGQTAGQLLKVLDRLGVPRRPAVIDAAPVVVASTDDDVNGFADDPWFEEFMYQEKLDTIVRRHAEKTGLPRPGTPAYSANPWAGDPGDWDAKGAQRHPWP